MRASDEDLCVVGRCLKKASSQTALVSIVCILAFINIASWIIHMHVATIVRPHMPVLFCPYQYQVNIITGMW